MGPRLCSPSVSKSPVKKVTPSDSDEGGIVDRFSEKTHEIRERDRAARTAARVNVRRSDMESAVPEIGFGNSHNISKLQCDF